MKQSTALKVLVSIVAVLVMAASLIWPHFNVPLYLGLGALAVLPWIYSVVRKVELPGGITIELKDMESAGKAVNDQNDTPAEPVRSKAPRPSYIAMAERDPNLAVVGLRIEIERRLRALALKHGMQADAETLDLLNALRDHQVLAGSAADGLERIIDAGNRAAHGARVEPQVADWAFGTGPRILASLDAQLLQEEIKDAEDQLKKALIILDFLQADLIGYADITEYCIAALTSAKRDGQVSFRFGSRHARHAAPKALAVLGALLVVHTYSDHAVCEITAFGQVLLSHLLADTSERQQA